MNILGETCCKICRNIINYENSKIVDAHVRDILDVLLLKLNMDEEANFLCDTCCTKLSAAFDFKVICINTEDTIFPYTNSEEGTLFDIREIYLKEIEDEQLNEITVDKKVCRLCFQVTSDKAVPLKEVDGDDIQRYIPEVNFNSTKDPVFCKPCYESLNSHCNFLKSYLSEEVGKCEATYESINTYSNSLDSCLDVEEIKCVIEKEETEINIEISKNCNVDANNPTSFGTNSFINSQSSSRGKGTTYICYKCDFKATHIHTFKKHLLEHAFPDEKGMFQCDQCSYKTRTKRYVVEHHFIHSAPLEAQIYKCHECEYEGIFKTFFMKHQQVHMWYRCNKCHFKSKHRSHLTSHTCVPLKCDKCPYETKYNRYAVMHRLKHTSTAEPFKCTTCTFETQSKRSLVKHKRSFHKDSLEEEVFKCEKCEYQSKKKRNLTKHRKKHEEQKGVQRKPRKPQRSFGSAHV